MILQTIHKEDQMIEVLFRNMDSSESLRAYLKHELRIVIFKHPRPALLKTRATISMNKTPFQFGENHFNIKIVSGPNMAHPLVVEKSAVTLTEAIREALDTFSLIVEKENHRHLRRDRHEERVFDQRIREA